MFVLDGGSSQDGGHCIVLVVAILGWIVGRPHNFSGRGKAGEAGNASTASLLGLLRNTYQFPTSHFVFLCMPNIKHQTQSMCEHNRYPELMFDLFHASGVSIYAMDHRDQGLSGRERDDVMMMTHVDSFEHHLDDAKMFIHSVVRPQVNKAAQEALEATKRHSDINKTNTQQSLNTPVIAPKLYIYGFSLGGLVAARVAVDEPDLFDAVVLVAPALVVNTPGLPSLAAELVTDFMCAIGSCESFVASTGTSTGHELPYPPLSKVSRSVERITFWENIR
jgi:pimeloyl-ACP methyl ester carboxylesterase